MSFVADNGERANRIWQLAESYEELVDRRKALEAWNGLHAGFMGRAPDHVASCISGMFMGLDVFEAYDPARAKALADYYRYARDNDLYLTYVIINPQADRSKTASQQKDPFLTAGVVDRDAAGITVRGAKMLATGGIMANEVLVTCIQPLAAGRREARRLLRHADERQGPEDPVAQIVRAGRAQHRSTTRWPAASTRTTPCSISTTSSAVGAGVRRSTAWRCARSNSTPRRRTSTRTTRRWCGCR